VTVAHGGQTGLNVFTKSLFRPPVYPQVAIKFVPQSVNWWGVYNIHWQVIATVWTNPSQSFRCHDL